MALERGGAALCLHDHHRQAVRDDVVQLAGDAGPLGGGGQRDPLVLLPLQVFGPFHQRAQVQAAAAHAVADRERQAEHQQHDDRLPDGRTDEIAEGRRRRLRFVQDGRARLEVRLLGQPGLLARGHAEVRP
ncbi:hypothetical protein Pflav_044440 [Phytohabitans flavus]|uniref:Uncharacterized protein n=1 Tax=Phytohabitans flavus TaxID=1076124 RepID=A0A6F8XW13_9ACTN|nr:hypothetical protein [Phytohabitans flavus]BCB78034.1 hypothetical protein Pflav_044440 [Phytohabitans flavus]